MVRRRRDECFSCLSPGYMASHLYFVKQWIWFCLEVAEVEPMRKWTGSKAVMTSRTACSSRSSSHALAGSSPGDTGHKAGLMPGVSREGGGGAKEREDKFHSLCLNSTTSGTLSAQATRALVKMHGSKKSVPGLGRAQRQRASATCVPGLCQQPQPCSDKANLPLWFRVIPIPIVVRVNVPGKTIPITEDGTRWAVC